MNISNLNYLEDAVEIDNLEGGNNFGATLSSFIQKLSQIQTVSFSGPTGSYAGTTGLQSIIETFGAAFLNLGNP
ncbi:MAG: hypothetical protein IGS48_10990 [Oscillatoriales cyanobacterium C42_A2020_001]|nr:hypothetical protein [Leptolyngbyaceae cyanobacterium C42_A2020_001]